MTRREERYVEEAPAQRSSGGSASNARSKLPTLQTPQDRYLLRPPYEDLEVARFKTSAQDESNPRAYGLLHDYMAEALLLDEVIPEEEIFEKHAFPENLVADLALARRSAAKYRKILRDALEIVAIVGPFLVSFRHIEKDKQLSLSEKCDLIDEFAREHPGGPVSEFVLSLFPELISGRSVSERELPEVAPALWTNDKQPGDTPVSFFERVYAPWRESISKPDVRRLDRGLYQAMATWVRRHPEDDPRLPTEREVTDSWVESVQSGKEPVPTDYKGKERLRSALRRRQVGHGHVE